MMLGDLPVLIALPTVWSLMAKSVAAFLLSRVTTIREDFLPLIDRLPRNPYLFGLGLN